MELLSQHESSIDLFFCPLRKKQVADLPEEKVRLKLIEQLTTQLGYPLDCLVAEKNLNQLPHLKGVPNLPKRRADLVVFAQKIHAGHLFYPLLLIECKAVELKPVVLRQLVGYNQFVGAYFVAVVNEAETYLGTYDFHRGDYIFQKGLLSYSRLMQKVSSNSIVEGFEELQEK